VKNIVKKYFIKILLDGVFEKYSSSVIILLKLNNYNLYIKIIEYSYIIDYGKFE
tara:strand:+ start:99 stop:260 length:162 start_codon:yes stop_codon:yes gene_type:complete